ncbi:MAG: type II secretion system protein GspM [Marinicella sp.]
MKNWFQNLTANEQRLLRTGTLLVILALIWVLVYLPVSKHITSQVDIKNRLQQQLQQMQVLTGSAVSAQAVEYKPMPTGMTFSAWVDQQLRAVNLQDLVNRIEPIDENSLTIWLQGAPFDTVIDWLQLIARQYAIQVDQIDVNVVDSSIGLTNIRMRIVKL